MNDSIRTTTSGTSCPSSQFKNFEEALSELTHLAQKKPVSLETFFSFLEGRGKLLLLIFVCLPIGQIPILAFGSGIGVVYLGIRIAFFNQSIWLPASILRKQVPKCFLAMATRQLLSFLKIMKRWTKPRYEWIFHHSMLRKCNGIFIALVGLSILLCPPIPLIGYISYLAVFFICIGLLNQDGVYIILGYLFSVLYFSMVLVMNHFFSLGKLLHWFK